MPPWFADPHYGKFSNDRTLAQAEIDTLVAWADTGAKAGNPKDAPKPLEFVEGWRIGKPDVVIEMPVAFDVPASGTIDYQYIVIPTGFKEDTYVQMAEARPGNPALVHHIIAFIREPGNPWMKDAKPGVPFVPKNMCRPRSGIPTAQESAGRRRFGGDSWPAMPPVWFRSCCSPGQAKLVKAGSDIILQMHYTANGKPGTDRSRIGLIFAKSQARSERVLTLAAGNHASSRSRPAIRITKSTPRLKLQHDATLVTLLPHMHFRGKRFRISRDLSDRREGNAARRAALRFQLAAHLRT